MITETVRRGRPRKVHDRKFYSIWLTGEQHFLLGRLAERTEQDKSIHVRRAIDEYLQRVFLAASVDEISEKVG